MKRNNDKQMGESACIEGCLNQDQMQSRAGHGKRSLCPVQKEWALSMQVSFGLPDIKGLNLLQTIISFCFLPSSFPLFGFFILRWESPQPPVSQVSQPSAGTQLSLGPSCFPFAATPWWSDKRWTGEGRSPSALQWC